MIIGAFGWALVAAVLLWLGFFVFTGERFFLVRWISYLLPWVSIFLLIFSAVVAIVRKWRLAAVLIALAALMFFPFMPRFFSQSIEMLPAQNIYKVMTYSKMGRNHDIDAVARVVNNEHPDILFVQEISEAESTRLLALITATYGQNFFWISHQYLGLVISRFPLVSEVLKADTTLAVSIALPEGVVHARNVHLKKSMGDTTAQYTMVNQLAQQCASESGPLIVAGDFNATIVNYPYVRMARHLDNAFERAGFGFGFTFPSPARRVGFLIPFMRIDHIFVSHHFAVHEAYVVDDAGESDHYPVVAKVSLSQGTMQ
ncbi:MAG: hypothetical protein CO186_05630 [Zetaproteobacteria bacterium CG_4_9_14_3_um_filter_49_83]|nr:MAG: hypothetical protein AUJ56_01260 [Zetaproteobacteria bacterium CG1_02_49_23]PIQ33823.1 MAG: hypothetical protein COW62_04075 [Zetaproteobacteria bacterium CG17_big_fil_post_rev_8_21_14_2_50_50_13]PIV30345.1 MAG: hypothetical protein COS35_07190 [Zetaproteobacteria bacterium CG02_land_8_20_14_3_00_50_9]PIY55585.1 MAG: hypothetical protein COZ00_08700 [Zetaproteobacteria bacterium CG_4_10_14_0_8_um_filter_49_80]PJA35477.1 MAG: hypothetical protein CO186_05630 [Zetaproteobacteria bacterium